MRRIKKQQKKNTGIYMLNILTRKVSLRFNTVGSNIQEHIKHKLIMNLEKFILSLNNPTKLFAFGSLWTAFHKLQEIEEKDLFSHYVEAAVSGLKITKIIKLYCKHKHFLLSGDFNITSFVYGI